MTESDLQSALAQLLREFSQEIDVAALERAIEDGDYKRIERIVGLTHNGTQMARLIDLLYEFILEVFLDQAEEEADDLGIDFDEDDPAIIAWATSAAVAQATGIIGHSLDSLSGIVLRGHSVGMSTPELARAIKSGAWLMDRNAGAIDSMRQRMTEGDLNDDQIQEAVDRASAVAIWGRAGITAAAIMTTALTAAKRFIWSVAEGMGMIVPGFATIEWETALDERVCPRCGPLHGMIVGFGESFPEGDPPLHPNCRCELILHVRFP